MAFCNSCLRSTDASVLAYTKHSSFSIKSLLRRQLFKKSSKLVKQRPILKSTRSSQLVGDINLIIDTPRTIDLTDNYDMTVNHDEELDETEVALSHRRSKRIPRWARKSQLQMAIINQMYYHDKNPEEIFGTVQLDLAREMVDSMDLWNTELPFFYSSDLPPNFV